MNGYQSTHSLHMQRDEADLHNCCQNAVQDLYCRVCHDMYIMPHMCTHSPRWPDFGIPSSPLPLRRLAHLLDESDNPQAGSPVVHCSAGIGRTGTFVAIDVVLKRLRSLDGKDIKGELLSLLLQSHLSG